MWLIDLLYRPGEDEVDKASADLFERFGSAAIDEANRLALVYQRRGARRGAKTFRLAARRLAERCRASSAGIEQAKV